MLTICLAETRTCGAAFLFLGGGLGISSLGTGDEMLVGGLLVAEADAEADAEAGSRLDTEFFFFKNEGSFLIWTLDRGQF